MRKADHKVNDIILNRWSPRAMSGESIEDEQLMELFEAARWAPSAYNNQPWVFIYAKRETKEWDKLFNLLGEFNQGWCKNAAALVVISSRTKADFQNKPIPTHAYDAGAAWENIALQGTKNGLVIHGMSGFDYDQAKKDLNIPDDIIVQAMFAVGKPGKMEDLPEDLRKMEFMSERKPIEDFVYNGAFRG